MAATFHCDICLKSVELLGGAPWPYYTLTDIGGYSRHLCSEDCVAQWAIRNGAKTVTWVGVMAK